MTIRKLASHAGRCHCKAAIQAAWSMAMTDADNAACSTWYDRSYGHRGFSARRLHPNGELLRYFSRHYFSLARDDRQSRPGLGGGLRVRRGGRFFSYAPSKQSTAFRDPGPSRLIDAGRLDGIRRQGAPFSGNLYPFRFIAAKANQIALEPCGMALTYLETVGGTYRRKEHFEFVVIVGER